jgi:ribosome biogenesis GTPase / thiamine phosphate phosphatase
MTLSFLGWNAFFADAFEPYADQGLIPARVSVQHRGSYVLLTDEGELRAEPAGRLMRDAAPAGLPAVGDWVAARSREEGRAMIHALLPRRTAFSRKVASGPSDRTEQQIVAANVDTVFLISGLGRDLNLRRLERYLTMAWESGAEPVIVLTKLDLYPDEAVAARAEVEAIAFGVPVHAVSGITGEGVEELDGYLAPGRTIALLGSSGVGKSTLVNFLSGREVLATRDVRADGRGRHTTTHRELVPLPGGALLLDTPGMRELQLWDAEEGLEGAFSDITVLAAECRFSDCAHDREPGCAVRAAIENGSLAAERFESYGKLQRELYRLEVQQNARLQADERKKRRAFARSLRRVQY